MRNKLNLKWIILVVVVAVFCSRGQLVFAQQIRVITTIPDLADITKQIGKDLVNVESLAKGVEFMHTVPVKPSFVPKLNRADLLVLMGLDMEASWIPALLEVASNSRILPGQAGYIDCSVGIPVLEAPARLDRAEGDLHPKGNPHFNLDPVYGKIIAQNIAAALSRNFPQHQPVFEKNLKAYLAELDRWIPRWQEMAAPLRGAKIVTYHLEWSYFAKRFGLEQVGFIEIKPGIEPTPNHLVNLAQKMKQEKAQLIIYGPQSDRFPRRLASETGAKALKLPDMVGGASGADSYIKMIDYNIRTMVGAIKGS
ncbi:MAG TPA: metal ABC transporter substrate-binding protein [Candidatus Udaeobacter sp.]|jgi:zinc/manganese transport system substrate-binding protein|nr:metal ABC transporter substrate-binding protein [Candidatus Udaeobacter sp.]